MRYEAPVKVVAEHNVAMPSELKTVASVNLQLQVEEDLKVADPEPAKGKELCEKSEATQKPKSLKQLKQ